jgi:hypothetical protein
MPLVSLPSKVLPAPPALLPRGPLSPPPAPSPGPLPFPSLNPPSDPPLPPPPPQGRVVSGHVDALDLVASRALAAGAMKATRLAVSGAFHTPLMEPARKRLLEV